MMNVREFISEVLSIADNLSDQVYIDLETDVEGFDTAEFGMTCSNGYFQITVEGVDGIVLVTKSEYEGLLSRIEELEEELKEL